MTSRNRLFLTLHLLADVAAASLVILGVCLVAFLAERKLTPEGLITWNENATSGRMAVRNDVTRYFTNTPLLNKTSYMGPDTAISLSTATTNTGKRIITYHVADIRISDIRDLRTAFAHDTFGVGITEPMLDMAARHDALLAMNGDFYCYQNGGMVVHNGILFRNEPSDAEVCAILANGEMRIINAGLDAKTLSLMAVWQAWTFGPSLLDGDGHAKRHFSTKKYIAVKNPRSAIGFFCPGHYCFVVCDGRRHGYSDGASLTELASIMEGLGCKVAYNMDGGSSSMLIFDNSVYNIPSDKGRDIGDCIFIRRSKQ